MTIYKKTWTRGALLLAALLLCTPAPAARQADTAQNSGQDGQSFGAWKLDRTNGLIRFQTHGTRMQGHQFGFILKPGHCDDYVLWVAWSSTKAPPIALKLVHSARLKITAAGKTVKATVPLTTAMPITQNLTAFALTNYDFSDRFLDLVQRTKSVKVRLAGPPPLLNLLSIKADSFSGKGFAKARSAAVAMCKRNSSPK